MFSEMIKPVLQNQFCKKDGLVHDLQEDEAVGDAADLCHLLQFFEPGFHLFGEKSVTNVMHIEVRCKGFDPFWYNISTAFKSDSRDCQEYHILF